MLGMRMALEMMEISEWKSGTKCCSALVGKDVFPYHFRRSLRLVNPDVLMMM